MKSSKFHITLLLVLLFYHVLPAQVLGDSSQVNPTRLKTIVVSSAILYPTSLVALDRLWYQDFPREGFHFFNDAHEWKQVDKIGHAYSAYHISSAGSRALQWSGLSSEKSYLWGGIMGLLFMTPIEIMDGYSSEYGASASDMVFNIFGASLFTSQGLIWNETRIHLKYSFAKSDLAPLRPQTLGDGFTEEILKDYNGQTYWLSFDMSKLLTVNNKFPKWLNLAIGYGAQDMIYATDEANLTNNHTPYRQYYVSIDLDLTHIETKSKWVKTLIYFVNMIHLPSPALEYNSKGDIKFHVLKF